LLQCPVDVFAGEPPSSSRKARNHPAFEALVQGDRSLIVVQVLRQQRQRQLRRTTTAITALESSGTVIPEIQAGI